MSNQPPIEVPQGAIRLNTDSQKLEFFAQDRWYEFATNTPTLDGGARGLIVGGYNGSNRIDTVEFITISTAGNLSKVISLFKIRAPITNPSLLITASAIPSSPFTYMSGTLV